MASTQTSESQLRVDHKSSDTNAGVALGILATLVCIIMIGLGVFIFYLYRKKLKESEEHTVKEPELKEQVKAGGSGYPRNPSDPARNNPLFQNSSKPEKLDQESTAVQEKPNFLGGVYKIPEPRPQVNFKNEKEPEKPQVNTRSEPYKEPEPIKLPKFQEPPVYSEPQRREVPQLGIPQKKIEGEIPEKRKESSSNSSSEAEIINNESPKEIPQKKELPSKQEPNDPRKVPPELKASPFPRANELAFFRQEGPTEPQLPVAASAPQEDIQIIASSYSAWDDEEF